MGVANDLNFTADNESYLYMSSFDYTNVYDSIYATPSVHVGEK